MKIVSFENLSKYNELLSQKTVRSVNSVKPDSNGNVTLDELNFEIKFEMLDFSK